MSYQKSPDHKWHDSPQWHWWGIIFHSYAWIFPPCCAKTNFKTNESSFFLWASQQAPTSQKTSIGKKEKAHGPSTCGEVEIHPRKNHQVIKATFNQREKTNDWDGEMCVWIPQPLSISPSLNEKVYLWNILLSHETLDPWVSLSHVLSNSCHSIGSPDLHSSGTLLCMMGLLR